MRVILAAVKIGLAVAVVNAMARTGSVYWSHYQLKDEAQQLAVFGYQTPTNVLHNLTVAKAAELQIPVREEAISVTRDGTITVIQASYEHPLEYFPNQTYPLKLSFSVEGRNLTAQAVK